MKNENPLAEQARAIEFISFVLQVSQHQVAPVYRAITAACCSIRWEIGLIYGSSSYSLFTYVACKTLDRVIVPSIPGRR